MLGTMGSHEINVVYFLEALIQLNNFDEEWEEWNNLTDKQFK